MSLTILSNYAAQVAHRNLMSANQAQTDSLAKLSSGSRVVSAKDDAASLAIGSRLQTEVAALKQASVNAGQAVSMLQIADGAMAQVGDILTRMKTLAVQAGSGQLGSTERGMLDTEYQSLNSEIDRIAQSTNFNGTSLVNGSSTTSTTANGQANAANYVQAADGFDKIELSNSVGDARLSMDYKASTHTLTVSNLTTGVSQSIDIGSTAIAQNGKQVVSFDNVGATITLNSAFNKSADLKPADTFSAAGAGAGSVQTGTIVVKNATAGATAITGNTVTISGAAAATATLTLSGGYSATVDMTATGQHSGVVLTNGTDSVTIDFTVDTAFNDAASAAGDGTFTIGGLGGLVFGAATTSNQTSFSFKVGSGTTSGVDDIGVSINSINTTALGTNGTDITSAANADTALTAISGAIDTLNTARANIGSSQNRMNFASANLSTAIENQDAARSALLDLDVASEMSNFTSKQILSQAGVSMLAQANQMPQSLLKLLG